MSVQDKRAFLENLRGEKGAEGLRSRVRSSLGIQQRLARGGRGTRGVNILAGMLGAQFGREDLVDLHKTLQGAGGADAAGEMIAERLGVSATGAAGKDIIEAVRAMKSGDTGKATEILRGVMGSKEIRESEEKKKETQKRQEDPLASKMEGHLSNIAKSFDSLHVKIGQQVAANLPKPPEQT